MKLSHAITFSAALLASANVSLAGTVVQAPEVSATGSLAAVAVVGAIGALIWERRRRK
ncbi:MAG: hypothetical protein AAGC81_09100 [Pseudomonadota bacterium]